MTVFISVLLLASAGYSQNEPFTKGKQIRIIVGFTARGIIDLWACLYTQHLGKYIPGNPDFIAQNVPGAAP